MSDFFFQFALRFSWTTFPWNELRKSGTIATLCPLRLLSVSAARSKSHPSATFIVVQELSGQLLQSRRVLLQKKSIASCQDGRFFPGKNKKKQTALCFKGRQITDFYETGEGHKGCFIKCSQRKAHRSLSTPVVSSLCVKITRLLLAWALLIRKMY